MAKKNEKAKKVDSIRHKDKRANIPTEELRDFVVDEEKAPETMLYPRDTSLDPQLVWKGKDEQDREDLAVPVVPIYIQEKIHPQAIIDSLPRIEKAEDNQFNLFADFNGGPAEFDQRIDFYHHEQNWSNRMILGDSLLVMTSLAEKEGLKGKVQTIYIDPPYGIKFGSNWQVSTRKRDVRDGKAEDATRQPEQIRAFRDTWELGIHSYLAYLRDRFIVTRELLTETGSIFVQIGDENVHLVRCLMDEIFGSENFISQIVFRKKLMPLGAKTLESMADYLLWYGKNKELLKYHQLFIEKRPDPSSRWTGLELEDGTRRLLSGDERNNLALVPTNAKVFSTVPQIAPSFSEKSVYPYEFNGVVYYPPKGSCWVTTKGKMEKLAFVDRLIVEAGSPRYIMYHDDFSYSKITNPWHDTPPALNKTYVVQTNELVVAKCIMMTSDPGDLILDPTCGSGTTAYVAEQWGRRWITCDTSRVALALARTRLMTAKFPYYFLADSEEGVKKESELTGKVSPDYETDRDIRKGFVYERVPHITLKSIANNPDIHEGMSKEEIKSAIVRNSDTEILYDKPYEDNKCVRVCGPFSVEGLSPHRVLSTADEDMDGTVSEREAQKQQDFVTMILENLKKSGIQNYKKRERIKFDRLDPYAGGKWLHAEGEYTDTKGENQRVTVSIGPEHGTVGPQQVKEAAKEAVQGVGYDMLITCGFAFDPHISEEVKRYGKLTVLPAKMNPDLAMGDELLKKTGSGNLFMVFGEPDIEIKEEDGDEIIVIIKGLDIYDPTTGEIRSSSTDEIACWFIDTNYSGESFFVRHAYFTGAGEPYDKLKRTLRAEIDEEAWESIYSTESRPFPKPESGKIAIKVINHFGDEVLKVFEV